MGATAAFAHVSLEQASAEAGAAYRAVLRVGHGCDGSPTTGITVQIPPQLRAVKPEPKPGWDLAVEGAQVRWTAGKGAALPPAQRGEFVLNTTAPAAPAALWFKVLQTCEQGRNDWAQLPASGTSTEGLKSPAVLLQVLSPAQFALARPAPVEAQGAWIRPAVPGQQGTGGFMRLTAREPLQLVGLSSPVAGVAEVHEMKMEGELMKMRPVGVLDLPAGKTVELKPGGYHLMLMDLKQPLPADSTVPLVLLFRNALGVSSRLELKVPVKAGAPADAHKH
jgi:copper(I)-binding protein